MKNLRGREITWEDVKETTKCNNLKEFMVSLFLSGWIISYCIEFILLVI